MLPIIKILRLPNLAIIAITQIFIRYFVIEPLLNANGFVLVLSNFHFILIIISTVFIAAGGYIINDYYDLKIDLINKPQKARLNMQLSRQTTMALYYILTFTGILGGIYVFTVNGLRSINFIFIIIAGLLWFYTATYKKQFIIGNLIVAVLTAMVPFIVFLCDGITLINIYKEFRINLIFIKLALYITLTYSVFAFLLTLIREIIKDCEDYEGDLIDDRKTIPLILGTNNAKFIISALIIIVEIIVIYILIKYLLSVSFIIFSLLFILLPANYLLFMIIKAKEKSHYHKASILSKIIMAAGIVSTILIKYHILA